jgi:hypothetical protein
MPAPDLETLASRVAGHDESLRAISDTLVDLTQDVRTLTRRVDGLQETVDQHTAILDQHTATLDQHTGMLTEILRIVRGPAPRGPAPAVGEGDPPSPGGDR